VRWLVLTEPLALPTEWIDAFGAILDNGDNARPVQPRRDRDVLADT
jgi:carbonic anhydrase